MFSNMFIFSEYITVLYMFFTNFSFGLIESRLILTHVSVFSLLLYVVLEHNISIDDGNNLLS